VVIGGGYGGATAAKYVKMWAPDVDVVVVERNTRFISCPISNLVLAGNTTMQEITMGYDALRARGRARDPRRRDCHRCGPAPGPLGRRRCSSPTIARLCRPVSTSCTTRFRVYSAPRPQQRILHAWKAGEQTVALRKQLEAMPDGGVYVLQIPVATLSLPARPYERICQVADYFKRAKPRSKIIVLDANPDIVSKKGLFLPDGTGLQRHDRVPRRTASSPTSTCGHDREAPVRGRERHVINIVPPHRAGDIAQKSGLITANQRWCGVDWLTAESVAVKNIHVIGDSTLSASAMPKSASMANQHGKLARPA
jgi:hypothetical protein